MKISFMTLGCPTWDLDTICAKGREYGYDGVDLRGLLETLDITTLPAFTSDIAETRSKFIDAGLEVSGIASSIKLCEPEKRQQNLEEARRTIGVAHSLGCRNIRVFGGGDLTISSRAKLAEIGRESMAQILELDGAREVYWLFETHDNWISARDC